MNFSNLEQETSALAFLREVLLKPKFENLKQLSLISFTNGNATIEALCTLLEEDCPEFIQNLETFEINGINLEGDQIFDRLNTVLLKMTKLEHIKLVGTAIAENLGELSAAFRRPQLKSINL